MIFDARSIPELLEGCLSDENGNRRRGAMRELSEAIGCHSSYISQVLRGVSFFSVDQAFPLAKYLKLSSDEKEYLICLVQRDRAGTGESRKFFESQIERLQLQNQNLQTRWEFNSLPAEQAEHLFFSKWIVQAVFSLCQIKPRITEEELCRRLQVDRRAIERAIHSLQLIGILSRANEKWSVLENNLSLKRGSAVSDQFHISWRLKSIEHISSSGSSNGQFVSSLAVISKEVANDLEREIFGFLDRAKPKILKSESKELYCLNLDFFSL